MEGNIKVKKEYAGVDIFKFFCAILVVAIHCKPFVNNFWLDAGIGLITRFAVPYFFLSSSYFLFSKLQRVTQRSEKINIYKGYFFRLLRFYAIYFLMFRFFDVISSGKIKSFLWYIKQFFLPTDGSSLWFVAALIYGTLIVFVMTLTLDRKIVFAVSIFFLVVGYSLSTLLNVTKAFPITQFLNEYAVSFIGVQNGLFFAFPYVALGSLMAQKEYSKNYIKDGIAAVLFFAVLGIESIVAVVVLDAPYTFLWISALPMTYFVMKITLTVQIKTSQAFYYIRKTSTLIYVFHSILVKLIIRLFNELGISSFDSQNILLFICTVAVSVGLAYMIVYLSRFKKLAFLKYIM